MMEQESLIIAEAGVNHNGNLDLAFKMIASAAQSGADVIKFQTFKAERVASHLARKAEYQKHSGPEDQSQLDMIRQWELDEAAHVKLMACCRQVGIDFLSSPFDLESIELLDRLGIERFKIPSGEITNLPFLRAIGGTGKKVILSTGMANLGEIETALDVMVNEGTPLSDIAVLHCNTAYPTPFLDVNLRAMITIGRAFPGIAIGYSDHSLGIEVPIAAVALGASIIEKHFTLDRTMTGPDHRASLEPGDFKNMVCAIRNVEAAMGDGRKWPSPLECKNMAVVRKSIVAARYIEKGELFTEKNITIKRPGTGLSPMRWEKTLGKRATRSYQMDDLIDA